MEDAYIASKLAREYTREEALVNTARELYGEIP